ncbi:hypothetical protein Sjap_006907 [Stephania japonica]|uniref:Uncharacterized protein n=1 Tax=Stephania japonica TaxID=461633 RepID=A0AAP0K8J5_9MAGN
MARGGKIISNRVKNRKANSIKRGSDDSDDDYVLGDDEEMNESEELYLSAEYASEESDENRAMSDSTDEEEVRKVNRVKISKPKKGSKVKKETRVRQRVKKNNRVSDDEEEDYDFDDEDDEEFDPDAIDILDEEEELLVKKKNNQVRKPVRDKRVFVKNKKRKRKSKVSKKPLKKKPRKLVVRRTVSSDDDFDVDYKAAPRKVKKKGMRKNMKSDVDLDSDFACSGSSDVEYTVSDEQAELLSEANKFCGNLRAYSMDSSLSTRLRGGGALHFRQSKQMGPKGKEKVLNLQNDLGKQICGICLSEEGKGIIQGTLNCCGHFFCYACIMEWSKVESRCPLCKQRFATISKPARTNIGIDLRNTVIQVPKRDQVYQPSEEELRGYLDPYENVVCMECLHGGDDSLMLLCDLCDSPVHTYCVGLGREVPEGNWYCKGCRSADPGSSTLPNLDLNQPCQGTSCNDIGSDLRLGPEESNPGPRYSVSVTDLPSAHRIETLSSPRYPVGEDVHAISPTGLGVSTLSGRRRLHRQIHNLLSNSNRASQIAELFGRFDGAPYDNARSEARNTEVEQFGTIAQRTGNFVNRAFQPAPIERYFHESEDKIPISAIFGHSQRPVTQNPSITSATGSTFLIEGLDATNSLMGFEHPYQCRRPLNRPDNDIHPRGYFRGQGAEERCTQQ